ncbi:aminotransferase class III-fold pyridoxal phosphate-dependent enzyme [Nocardia sp. NPDC050710]|uniref:aspartate aminotransferase family protein n=1 Tax=Nocardia sp. NPDC050710 TaxID=3157220 RepID=UPI0033C6F931
MLIQDNGEGSHLRRLPAGMDNAPQRSSPADPMIVAAAGATFTTADDRELIDFSSGSFGYGHPGVLRAVSEQMRVLPQSTRMFLNRPLGALVRAIAEATPGNLSVTYPCNSATEGVEGALKLALGYQRRSGRSGFVVTYGSRHGNTRGAASISRAAPHECDPTDPAPPVDVEFVPFGDSDALRRSVRARRPAGVVVEPVASGVGVEVPPPGYLREVREICDESATLLIVNETTTGLGRTGRVFAVDHENVVPDILVLGGALGGGALPAGAYVTTREINWRVYGRRGPWLHGSATGGNPLACAATVAVLEAVAREDIPGRCRDNGARLVAGLRTLHATHGDLIGEVAGFGQLAALRFADPAAARLIAGRALDHGVLVWQGGVGQGWVGLRPPLLASAAEIERGLASLDAALTIVAEERIA